MVQLAYGAARCMPVRPNASAATALPVEELLKLIHYDPLTGRFTWKIRANRGGRVCPGMEAGCGGNRGYSSILINGIRYPFHRLAWYSHSGRWPNTTIDHKNLSPLDNRTENLREATGIQQACSVPIAKRCERCGKEHEDGRSVDCPHS
jgi:hypothetical protein